MHRAPAAAVRAAAALLLCAAAAHAQSPAPAPQPPEWTRGATCYEVFVRSFQDSDGDGIGDFNGLTSRLDYLNDGNAETTGDLGVRCLWLMPISESPSYHGYDVTNYYRVEPDYGTEADFKRFMAEAHKRGIRVIVDLVLNHASSDHPFFQEALRDTASLYRNWFLWSPTPGPKNQWGGTNWHRSPLRNEYYYGFFWSGMPDFNFHTPAVLAEAKKVATFWLTEMNVDGFRLDAVRHLFEEGGKTENVPATHGVLREFAAHVRKVKPDAYTVGEVFDSLSAVLPYYPDQLDSYFAFELADSLIAAARTGNARGMLAPVLRLQEKVPHARWSPFLRNHDQPRTRTEVGGDPARARIASFLLMTMPGLPFVYYGEEIGMVGTKPDERLRTPMQWTAAPGGGFTTGQPWQQAQGDSAATTVEAQEGDSASLLHLHRRLIRLRAANPALASGEIVPLTTTDAAVTAYLRRTDDRTVLVIANVGASPVDSATITAAPGTFPAGQWLTRNLLGGPAASPIVATDDGAISGYVPLPTLAPLTGYLFEVETARVRKD